MRFIKKIWNNRTLKYLAAFLIPAIFILLLGRGLDNDSWYVLAEGRYIAENGVFYEDVLSMHEGLNTVVQNYGYAVIFYWIFSIFGAPGIYISVIILNFLVCFLLYKICMIISNKNVNLSLFIMIATDFILALSFVVTRAQMVSYVIFLCLIYLLELYIKTDKIKYLWWIPLLSVLQINLHASLWLMFFLVMGAYIVDSIKNPKLKLQGYRTWPLVVVFAISILTGLLNPYGVSMMTFIIAGYSNLVLKNLVAELRSFSPFVSTIESAIYISIFIISLLCIYAKNREFRMRYILMWFGFLALGLHTFKGLSQFVLVMFIPLALLCRKVRIENVFDAKLARRAVVFWSGIVSVCLFIVLLPIVSLSIEPNPDDNLVAAVDAIDANLEGMNKEDAKIYTVYTGYNTGGYLEYRGYKPYIDSRGEYFVKSINKKEDILREYYDFVNGSITADEMLSKYDFDYLLVAGENDPFYRLERKEYKLIYENDEHKTKVFEKV